MYTSDRLNYLAELIPMKMAQLGLVADGIVYSKQELEALADSFGITDPRAQLAVERALDDVRKTLDLLEANNGIVSNFINDESAQYAHPLPGFRREKLVLK